MATTLARLLLLTTVSFIAGFALWGWGWMARRCARVGPSSVPLTITLGLAAVLFLGGIANLARIAFPVTLDLILGVGGVVSAVVVWKQRSGASFVPSRGTLIALIPLVVAWVFLGVYLVPQAAFNIHDDLEKYFVHPVEMLALGTFPLNPLGSLGAETLGGQAFLHGFVAAHFPLSYLGAVDGFFCFVLCVALAAFAVKPGRWALGAVAAELCVVAINPQVVNISALFSGTALVMAAVMLSACRVSADRDVPSAALLGLVYAGLLALKVTFAPFVGIHLLAVVIVGRFPGWLRVRWLLQVGGWLLLFLAPWILLHARLYLLPATELGTVGPGVGGDDAADLFSTAKLGYGATQLHYTLLAIAGIFTAVVVLVAKARGWARQPPAFAAVVAAALTAGIIYFALVVAVGPRLFGAVGGTRYSCPILIGVIPVCMRLLERDGISSPWRFLPVIFGLCVTVAFVPSLGVRLRQLAHDRVPLAFYDQNLPEAKAEYVGYNQRVLHGPVRSKLAEIQARVPAGERLGVWVMTPFWLDFKRNPILHAEPAGLAMRWAHLPKDVHYFLLEYAGNAVRPDQEYFEMAASARIGDRILGTRVLAFLDELKVKAARAQFLYNDGSYVLMRLPDAP